MNWCCAFWPVVAAGLLSVATGCVSRQNQQFCGQMARGDSPPVAMNVDGFGQQVSCAIPSWPEALHEFRLAPAGGSIVIVHRIQGCEDSERRLTNESITAVYFAEIDAADAWHNTMDRKQFLRLDATARQQIEGVHRLEGMMDVERWKHNIDFRIRLDMRSVEPPAFRIAGTLSSSERWELHPVEWVVLTGLRLRSAVLHFRAMAHDQGSPPR